MIDDKASIHFGSLIKGIDSKKKYILAEYGEVPN